MTGEVASNDVTLLSRPARRRSLGVLVVLVLTVAAVLLGGELARGYAQHSAALRIQAALGLTRAPVVKIHDRWILAAAVRATLSHLTVTLDDSRALLAGRPLQIAHAQLDLYDVRFRGTSPIRAGSVTGTATVPWSEVAAATGVPFSATSEGRLVTGFDVKLLGRTVKVTVTVSPRVESGRLVFADPVFQTAGLPLPADIQLKLGDRLPPLALPVPPGMAVTGGSASLSGLSLNFGGSDVDLTGLG